MKTNLLKLTCGLALLGLPAAPGAWAQSTVYFATNPICNSDASFPVTGDWFTVGANSITISQLGFYDQGADGLSSSHQVGIYNASDTLLASATIDSGTTDSLINGYRWVNLSSSLTLDANTLYLVVTTTGSDGTVYGYASDANIGDGLAYSGESYGWNSEGELVVPDWNYVNEGSSGMWNNPNMTYTINSVPEPSTLALAGLGGLGLLWQFRRRK